MSVMALCLAAAVSACRDREPVPEFNENLGTETRPLLPTAGLHYDPEVGTSNKKVELPERPEPGTAARLPAADGAPSEPTPAPEEATTSGLAPAPTGVTTNGDQPSTAGTNGPENADTSGEAP
jgi:hypothetical protein